VPSLPRTGPVERYAALRAALDKRGFVAALDGVAVLIRLDERGGQDEPAPWAFHGSGLPLPVDVPSSEEDVFVDRSLISATSADESTITGPTFQISVPAARGRATVHVVPAEPEVTIGRESSCDIKISERSVSKKHARIVVGLGEQKINFTVVDEGSQNGIAINGKPLVKHGKQLVLSGDVIDLGDVSLLLLEAGEFYDGLPRLTDG
jgi:hypothetical protein